MATCPVCDRQTEGLLCTACGYDASQNREAYPTLAPIPTEIKSISFLKETWQARHQDLIRCPSCGGFHFTLNQKNRAIICVACSTPLPEDKKSPLYSPRPATAPTAPTAPKTLRSFLTSQIPPEGCRVVATGLNYEDSCNVDRWQNVIALSVSNFHTVGLKSDGTVVATGSQDQQECNTGSWNNIVDIDASIFYTCGLKADGTVVMTKKNRSYAKELKTWRNIRFITGNDYYLTALTNSNTVLTTKSGWNVAEEWTDITAIASTANTLFGLRLDGTVAAAYASLLDRPNVKDWRNIKAIAAGYNHIVGLRNDGTVVAAGDHLLDQCAVGSWQNIVAIAAGKNVTAGIRADGTVVCTNPDLDVSKWQRIVAIAVSAFHIVGLQLSEEQYAAQLHFKE